VFSSRIAIDFPPVSLLSILLVADILPDTNPTSHHPEIALRNIELGHVRYPFFQDPFLFSLSYIALTLLLSTELHICALAPEVTST
jgi:hypothetical protein